MKCKHNWISDYVMSGGQDVMTHCTECGIQKVISKDESDSRGDGGVNPAQERMRLG